jgi:mannose-6-phosphate isomerase-like protein (cupin superfamily)
MRALTTAKALPAGEGLRLGSRRGRELIFKVTGEDTNGALDFFTVKVAPKNGPPLHVHHASDEAIYVLRGRFKVVVGDETFYCDEGGFVFMPASLPHAFINLTDEEGEIIATYTPGGSQVFYEEIGRAVLDGADRETEASIFAKHNMTLLGPPLSAD